ncbi:MAG: tRNA (adenine(22)-N(1))-methyltransferase TrmK [Myxococcota bacterium]
MPAPPIALTGRAAAIAAMVPPDAASLAEVGYDRGLVLAAIAERFAATAPPPRLVGVEIQPAAHLRVPAPLAARVELRSGDGLAPLTPGEVEGVVMAGLGSKTMVALLEAQPATTAALRWLIACPSHFEDELRPGLERLGWHPAAERLVLDRGRFYEVILALPGPDPSAPDAVAARWGPRLLAGPDPLALDWLADLRRRFADAFAAGLAKAAVGAKLAHIDEVEARVERRALLHWRQ